ncbi:MAG: hypothetical protein P8077_07310 [Gammaproteobacteria bacterium]
MNKKELTLPNSDSNTDSSTSTGSSTGHTHTSPEVSAKIVSEFRELVGRCEHLAYAVNGCDVSSDNKWPEIASAPFVVHNRSDEEGFFILGSTLSRGSRSLLSVAGQATPRTNVFFALHSMEKPAGANAEEPFAVTRAQVVVRVEEVPRNDPLWAVILEKLSARFGQTARVLEQLSDFHMLGMFPCECLFIKGFGKAFSLSGQNLRQVAHLRQS